MPSRTGFTVTRKVDKRFDGDTSSADIQYAEDSVEEIDNLLANAKHYLNPVGGLIYSLSTDIVNLVVHNMTGDPIEV